MKLRGSLLLPLLLTAVLAFSGCIDASMRAGADGSYAQADAWAGSDDDHHDESADSDSWSSSWSAHGGGTEMHMHGKAKVREERHADYHYGESSDVSGTFSRKWSWPVEAESAAIDVTFNVRPVNNHTPLVRDFSIDLKDGAGRAIQHIGGGVSAEASPASQTLVDYHHRGGLSDGQVGAWYLRAYGDVDPVIDGVCVCHYDVTIDVHY